MNLLRSLAIVLISLLLLVIPGESMMRAFFTSQESVEKELVRLIDESHSTIDLALFRFASQPLALAIRRARARHVRIRIVLDGHSEAEGKDKMLGLAFVSGEVRRLDGKRGGTQGIMHHKFVLFDKERVVTGSFNWTAGAEHINYENALLTDTSSVVAAYNREFERLWGRAETINPRPVYAAPPAVKKLRIPIASPSKKKHHSRKKKSRRH